jgi:hypothetical protein
MKIENIGNLQITVLIPQVIQGESTCVRYPVHIAVHVSVRLRPDTGTWAKSGVCLVTIIVIDKDGDDMHVSYMKLKTRFGKSDKQIYNEMTCVFPGTATSYMRIIRCVLHFNNQ